MNEYELFLEQKQKKHIQSGFKVNIDTPHLFPFQKWVVERALLAGKYGVFSGTGTGKSRMQLVWCEQVVLKTGKPVLLLAPLGVGSQTTLDAGVIGKVSDKAAAKTFKINAELSLLLNEYPLIAELINKADLTTEII